MTIWFTSDLHLGHAGVVNFCKRPFADVSSMDAVIIKRWNQLVRPEDRIYVLGDISFYKPTIGVPLLRELRGHKILVRGNHDKYSVAQYVKAGFADVAEELVIRLAGRTIRLSHYPYWPQPTEEKLMLPHELRYPERRPIRKGHESLLCGHVHERWLQNGRMINVGVDVWDFAPVSQGMIESLLVKPVEAEFAYGEP